MYKLKAKKIAWYVVLYLTFLILSCYMVNRDDDFVFKAGIARYGGFLGWLKFFSHNWGGRVVPQGILVILLRFPDIVFHFFDAFAWVMLLVYVKKVFDIDGMLSERFVCVMVPVLLFVLLPVYVLSGTVFWKCANVLYLWGSASLLMAIYPIAAAIHGDKAKLYDYIFSFISVIYTSSIEQTGALMCGAFVLCIFFAFFIRVKLEMKDYALAAFAIAATFFFCTLPGNAVRNYAETLGQLPKYDMYSVIDKTLWGLVYVIGNIEGDVIFIVLLLASTVTYIMHRYRRSTDPLLIGAYIVLVYFALCTINQIGLKNAGKGYFIADLFELVQIDTIEFGVDVTLVIRNIIHFMMFVYLGCCILVTDSDRLDITGFIFYFGGLATMWVMGFSPTIYASGARPRFLCYLFLICVEIRIISFAAAGQKEYWNNLTSALQKKCIEEKPSVLSMKVKKRLTAGLAIAAVVCLMGGAVALRTPRLPVEWKETATEYGEFSVPDRWVYRFGTDDDWSLKVVDAGTYMVDTDTFSGIGSVPGVVNEVYSLEIPDEFWKKVCDENGRFSEESQMMFRYGVDGTYFYKILKSGSYIAMNELFGGDPVQDKVKEVYTTVIPDKYWKKVADENERFSAEVGIYRYGAGDKWNYLLLNSGDYTAGEDEYFGTDPVFGTKKEVYRLNLKID